MRTLQIKGTPVLKKNLEAKSRIVVNQGGTRSSKTYSIAQKWVIRLHECTGKTLTICRKTMPSLKGSVMRDFFEILGTHGLYSQENHNKTENTYVLHGNLVEFISLDQPQKKRGAKRNFLWLNEANEFTFEDFQQLNMRTTEQVDIDYNPSDEYHWIYDHILSRDDCTFIHSTYLDNPFLDKALVKEIERLKEVDENYWRIYGLGEKGFSQTKVYGNWDVVDSFPEFDETCYGMDFGFNNPTALVFIGFKDKEVFVKEALYESYLTTKDLIPRLKDIVTGGEMIHADCAEPDRIEEIAREGIYIVGAKKGKNSVKDGIDNLKATKIHVHHESVNLIKELKSYQWKVDRDGNVLDEPVKFNDHALDAMRYATYREEAVNIRWL